MRKLIDVMEMVAQVVMMTMTLMDVVVIVIVVVVMMMTLVLMHMMTMTHPTITSTWIADDVDDVDSLQQPPERGCSRMRFPDCRTRSDST